MTQPPLPSGRPQRILAVVGTRPEVIKLAPVLRALQPTVHAGRVQLRVVDTGQQPDLAQAALASFGLRPDHQLRLDRDDDDLSALHAALLAPLATLMARERPDRVLVQGDTSSALAGAMAAFYAGVPVAHIEAGLRTWDPASPFPEEMHRRWITACADLHFCPTEGARRNLLDEGVDRRTVHLVGNTVIDALELTRERAAPPAELTGIAGRVVYVTVHRRENLGRLESHILPTLARVLQGAPDVHLLWPLHPHPAIGATVRAQLGAHPRVHLRPGLDYAASLGLIQRCALVLTDSGGLQEEATALGAPVLVLRGVTERVEAVTSGNARICGTDPEAAAARILEVLGDAALSARMARPSDVFGQGHAAHRIVQILLGDG